PGGRRRRAPSHRGTRRSARRRHDDHAVPRNREPPMTVPPPSLRAVPLSRLRPADLLPVATVGLRTRRVRAALAVLGIAIGIAAGVAVLGITRSSQAELLARIDALGTNLLTVNAGSVNGTEIPLPATAGATVRQVGGVLAAAATAELPGVRV